MAKISNITVEIKPTVSEDTALICLRLVELFLNSNSQYWLDFAKHENGEIHLYFSQRTDKGGDI